MEKLVESHIVQYYKVRTLELDLRCERQKLRSTEFELIEILAKSGKYHCLKINKPALVRELSINA